MKSTMENRTIMHVSKIIYTTFFLFILQASWAQEKLDHVLMLNGENKAGKVVGISTDAIEFIHDGESLKYTLQKSNISKIEFASGRIETFNEMPSKAAEKAALVDHHNKIAVLPFIYIRDGVQQKNDAMERKVQGEFFSRMQDHIGILKAQNTQETNAILAKNGVNDENFIQFTMPEIANMLGVEYIIQSTLSVSKEGATTYNYSSAVIDKDKDKNKTRAYGSSASSTQIQFQTDMEMTLYNDKGEVVWTRTKQSFWPNEDAYKETLKFMLKRMPIYQK